MRKLRAILSIVFLSALASGLLFAQSACDMSNNCPASGAVIALVNSATSGLIVTAGTSGATAPLNVTAGNTLVVLVRTGATLNTLISCLDTATGNDTFSELPTSDGGTGVGGVGSLEFLYAKNVTGNAAVVVTCSWDNSTGYDWVNLYQVSGLSTTSPSDKNPTASTCASSCGMTLSTGATGTLSSANEIIFASGTGGGLTANTMTAGGSFTLGIVTTATLSQSADEYKIVTANTTITPTMTRTGSTNWGMIASTFTH